MEFRDLKRQYLSHKEQIDAALAEVLRDTRFISGPQISELEQRLAAFAGRQVETVCGQLIKLLK